MVDKQKPKDFLLEMAKSQGYIPVGCSLDGSLVMALVNSGENPCHGCNGDRIICKGQSKKKGGL